MNQAPDAVGTADAKSQPKWLNPIIVAAMVLGSLFGCCGITSVGGAAVGRDVSVATLEVQAQSAKDPAAAEMSRRSAKLQKAFQDRTYPLSMTVAVIGLLQSLALGIAGILASRRRPVGRRMLAAVCAIGIGVEVVAGGAALYLSTETSAFAQDMMKATFAAQSQQQALNEESREVVEKIGMGAARAGSVLGVIMVLGFFAVKVAYYVFSTLYLRRKEVIDYFEDARAATA